MVDRFVHHIYFGTYHLDHGGQAIHLHLATKVLDSSPEAYALREYPPLQFHYEMYCMGEFFGYQDLMTTALLRIIDLLLQRGNVTPELVMGLIAAVYAPASENTCKDEGGRLQRVLVAAVIVHWNRYWTEEQKLVFNQLSASYADFSLEWMAAVHKCSDIVDGWNSGKRKHAARKGKKHG